MTRATAAPAVRSDPPFSFPESDFETLVSMIKIQDRRFRPTMERISAAIEVAGNFDISSRLAQELHITRGQASRLLTALRGLVAAPNPGQVAKK